MSEHAGRRLQCNHGYIPEKSPRYEILLVNLAVGGEKVNILQNDYLMGGQLSSDDIVEAAKMPIVYLIAIGLASRILVWLSGQTAWVVSPLVMLLSLVIYLGVGYNLVKKSGFALSNAFVTGVWIAFTSLIVLSLVDIAYYLLVPSAQNNPLAGVSSVDIVFALGGIGLRAAASGGILAGIGGFIGKAAAGSAAKQENTGKSPARKSP